MEVKNNSDNVPKPLLSLTWVLEKKGFIHESSILWRGIELQIRVRVVWNKMPSGFRLYYDFCYDKKHYFYRELYSCVYSSSGKIPEIKSCSHKLLIIAKQTSLEIIE